MRKLVKRAGRDKIEAVPDRIIVLKNAGAPAQAADEANFRIKQSAVVGVVWDRPRAHKSKVFRDRDDDDHPG